jgi:beta-galactosidase/beta-glucuronidase
MLKLDHLKIVLAINSLLFVLAATAVESHAEAVRQRMLIDSDWRFVLGDVQGAQAVRLDDASWQRVGLPHSFGIPYFGSSKFYIGYGWYRKHILLKHIASGQRMAIEFEAAFQDAEVFVNGQRVGEHLGGYTGFSMDITKELHGGDNVIGVRLNNNWNPQLNPRAGEHNFNGGIYRNVYLVS